MKTKDFVEFLASAPSPRDESHRITQNLIDVLLEAPDEVALKDISRVACVAHATFWARVAKAGIKRCGTTVGSWGHKIHLYKRDELLRMLGVER